MTVVAATMEVEEPGEMRSAFAHVESWVFDLDDTLYPRSLGLHNRLKQRVVLFIADHLKIDSAAAEAVHLDYYERFGATLQGLVELHGVPPNVFLDFVHNIDLSSLAPNEALNEALRALPGRRFVLTNASRAHAAAALNAMGMADLFVTIASIEDNDFVGKPHPDAFQRFFEAHSIDPVVSAMFEDRAANLVVPHRLGMKTALVIDRMPEDVSIGRAAERPRHVDAVVDDLAAFLNNLATRK